MEAYYASSNIQLLNLLNLKVTIFSSCEGDLYITNNGKISPELITLIQDAAIFRNINLINIKDILPKSYRNRSLFQKVLDSFIKRAYYYHQISSYAHGITYSRLIFNGFWMDGTYILLILASQNPDLRISFIDEGVNSYNYSKKELCSTGGSGILGNLWYYFVFYSKFRKISSYRKCVDDIFLYQPDLYVDKKNIVIKQLPIINDENPICLNILRKLSCNIDCTEYKRRNVYYFLQNQYNSPNEKKIIDEYLDILTQTIDPQQIIIKEHPGSIAGFFSQTQYHNMTDLFIDKRLYLFEATLLNIDINEKVFISRDSSSLMYPKYMFDAEPFVILTYKLYPEYYTSNIEKMDSLSNGLISSYVKKERILIPTDMSEFKYMLENIIKPFLSNVENA